MGSYLSQKQTSTGGAHRVVVFLLAILRDQPAVVAAA
jgi:hypothetical protein